METYFSNLTAEEGTKERLLRDLAILAQDAEELVKAIGSQAAEKSKVELASALERLKTNCRALRDKSALSARAADRVIREHPYHSIGLAFGAGLLLGVLVNRNGHDD
jgi:ElaB/YqjD/DUF883 family membrane-anchored ribosome-binding protein